MICAIVLFCSCGDNFSEGLIFTSNGDGTCYIAGIGACTDTNIVIPTRSPVGDIITSIGDNAFSGYGSLRKVTIGNGTRVIGNNAFADCTSLTNIEIPNGVTDIGNHAFYGCSSLTSIEIPNGVTSIGFCAFQDCSSLTNIRIPNSVKNIKNSVLANCTSLTRIDYQGTMAEWNAISKSSYWDSKAGMFTIHCTDGNISRNE